MSKRKTILDPIRVGKDRWFYANKGFIDAYRDVRNAEGSYLHSVEVPWSVIKEAQRRLRAHENAKRAKRKARADSK